MIPVIWTEAVVYTLMISSKVKKWWKKRGEVLQCHISGIISIALIASAPGIQLRIMPGDAVFVERYAPLGSKISSNVLAGRDLIVQRYQPVWSN